MKKEQFKSPGIVFDVRTGEEFDLTDKVLVSKSGKVLILARRFGKQLRKEHYAKARKTTTGYLQISVADDYGKRRFIYIHRLVGFAWLNRTSNQKIIMHKDDNRLNNNVNNLMWGTHEENIKDMINKNRDNFYGKKTNNNLVK